MDQGRPARSMQEPYKHVDPPECAKPGIFTSSLLHFTLELSCWMSTILSDFTMAGLQVAKKDLRKRIRDVLQRIPADSIAHQCQPDLAERSSDCKRPKLTRHSESGHE